MRRKTLGKVMRLLQMKYCKKISKNETNRGIDVIDETIVVAKDNVEMKDLLDDHGL